jgi:hypothetical protein
MGKCATFRAHVNLLSRPTTLVKRVRGRIKEELYWSTHTTYSSQHRKTDLPQLNEITVLESGVFPRSPVLSVVTPPVLGRLFRSEPFDRMNLAVGLHFRPSLALLLLKTQLHRLCLGDAALLKRGQSQGHVRGSKTFISNL